MRLMRELVSSANVYLTDRGTLANARLLQTIAQYLTFLLRVFGVVPSDAGLGFPVEQEGTTDQVSMCVSALALQQWPRVCSKSASQTLKLCNVVSCAVWHTTPLPSQEAVVMPYLTALADFREQIRKVALENKGTCTSYRLALLCRGHLINNS